MTTVIIVIHLMVVLAMIGLVLLQRSEGGALGIGGGQGAFMSGRGAGNMLTRSTAILAGVFFVTSLGLALLAKYEASPGDILQRIPGQTAPATTEAPVPPAPAGAPSNAEELLQQLGGSSDNAGPQAPPAQPAPAESAPVAPEAEAPASEAPAAEAPVTQTPAPAEAPGAAAPEPAAPADNAPESAPAPQTPPAGGGSGQ